jgi:hypothetical protein
MRSSALAYARRTRALSDKAHGEPEGAEAHEARDEQELADAGDAEVE